MNFVYEGKNSMNSITVFSKAEITKNKENLFDIFFLSLINLGAFLSSIIFENYLFLNTKSKIPTYIPDLVIQCKIIDQYSL